MGNAAITDLIDSNERRFNPLALYALGVIGGKKSAAYLMDKAKTEENVWNLTDYYYCALATHNADARKLVEEAAKSSSPDNRSSIAESVLKMKLPDTARIVEGTPAK